VGQVFTLLDPSPGTGSWPSQSASSSRASSPTGNLNFRAVDSVVYLGSGQRHFLLVIDCISRNFEVVGGDETRYYANR
jgi:hypothetical protein